MRDKTRITFLTIGLFYCVFAFGGRSSAQQYVDGAPGHQETWEGVTLHACPIGYAMLGAHVDNNQFTCLRVVPAAQESQVQSLLDGGTQGTVEGVTMHVCPGGMYMRGLHKDLNQLLCSSSPSVHLTAEFLDGKGNPYQLNGMHACPDKNGRHALMTGIDVAKNDFACAVF